MATKPIAARFQAAAARHRHDFDDLRAYRGVGFCAGDVVHDSIDQFSIWLRLAFPLDDLSTTLFPGDIRRVLESESAGHLF